MRYILLILLVILYLFDFVDIYFILSQAGTCISSRLQNGGKETLSCDAKQAYCLHLVGVPSGLRPLIRDPLNLIRLIPAKGYKGKVNFQFCVTARPVVFVVGRGIKQASFERRSGQANIHVF